MERGTHWKYCRFLFVVVVVVAAAAAVLAVGFLFSVVVFRAKTENLKVLFQAGDKLQLSQKRLGRGYDMNRWARILFRYFRL